MTEREKLGLNANIDAYMDTTPIMKFFRFAHLPEHLQAHSIPWADLAVHVCNTVPANAERTVALRKLLEGKDAAVRAALS